MRGMRVLFTATPGWGHIHPMVPLARALVDRGDDVVWATAPEVCERLARDGFATAPAGLGERAGMEAFFEGIRDRPVPTRTELPVLMFPGLFGAVRPGPMLADLLPLAEAWSPDLLVCDAADFAGPLVAALVEEHQQLTALLAWFVQVLLDEWELDVPLRRARPAPAPGRRGGSGGPA